MKKVFLIISVIFNLGIKSPSSAQEGCNCLETFEWMVTTFEQNDAGFQHVIDKKGQKDYKNHTDSFRKKAQNALTLNTCQNILFEWLHYFRTGHMYAGIKDPDKSELSSDNIRNLFRDELKVDLSEKQLMEILAKKKNNDPLEGIWNKGDYKIGIIVDEKSQNKFIGFILKADSVYWLPGQVKVELTKKKENSYVGTYAMENHLKRATDARIINSAGTLLFLFDGYWVKQNSNHTLSENERFLLSMAKANKPFLQKLGEKSLYLRIPSFSMDQKEIIDSLLHANDPLITLTENLIIDIRNGNGGSDASYRKIRPYLYTNPVRGLSVQIYATELNAQCFEKYAKMISDTGTVQFWLSIAKKMRENKGTFIDVSEQSFSMDTLKKVLVYPQKVAIICNKHNGSSDEEFLLVAKQSQKVKIFGRPTGGMLDVSNMNYVFSPDNKFALGYCMSKSYRIPDYCIDGVGIQPDYFLDDAIPEADWIEYVKSILE